MNETQQPRKMTIDRVPDNKELWLGFTLDQSATNLTTTPLTDDAKVSLRLVPAPGYEGVVWFVSGVQHAGTMDYYWGGVRGLPGKRFACAADPTHTFDRSSRWYQWAQEWQQVFATQVPLSAIEAVVKTAGLKGGAVAIALAARLLADRQDVHELLSEMKKILNKPAALREMLAGYPEVTTIDEGLLRATCAAALTLLKLIK